MSGSQPPVSWTPFDLACRLQSLRYGSLDVGNTLQNKTNLYNLAVAEANNYPNGTGWAKWRGGGGMPVYKSRGNLLLNIELVPGFTAPAGTGSYQDVAGSSTNQYIILAGSGAESTYFSDSGIVGYTAAGIGSILSGGATLNGETIEVIGYVTSELHTTDFVVVLPGSLAQTFFTSVAFTDRAGNVETYETSSATYGTTSDGYTIWYWSSQYSGSGDPFASGQPYIFTFNGSAASGALTEMIAGTGTGTEPGSATAVGFALYPFSSDVGYNFGCLVPTGGTLDGETVVAFYYDETAGDVVLICSGDLAQTAFTSISFEDNLSTVETYEAAGATFSNLSGPYSMWYWSSLRSGGGNPFTTGTAYPLTIV